MIDVYEYYRIICQNVKSDLNFVLPLWGTCGKSKGDIVPPTLPQWHHPCILAADYLHSTAAGTMHLEHTEDESIRQREK